MKASPPSRLSSFIARAAILLAWNGKQAALACEPKWMHALLGCLEEHAVGLSHAMPLMKQVARHLSDSHYY